MIYNNDKIYKLFSSLYLTARNIKNKQFKNYINDFYIQDDKVVQINNFPCNFNGKEYKSDEKINFFYGENSTKLSGNMLKMYWKDVIPQKSANFPELWWHIIKFSRVPDGYTNSKLYQTGYILEKKIPTQSSWIWTTASISRAFYEYNKTYECLEVADTFLELQLDEGGWVVRNDEDFNNIIPVVAPNDSAYIARHAILNAYKLTGNEKYLDSAIKCANWIMRNKILGGLVPTNVDKANQNIIVDIGFTMSLFTELYSITKDGMYLEYFRNFKTLFIYFFYEYDKKLFSTSIDIEGQKHGGYFSRGQAWALEGLIDIYKVIPDENLFNVIDCTVNELITLQKLDGSWSYNFSKPLLGTDNKGISIIGNTIMDWYKYSSNKDMVIKAAKKSLNWCYKHTQLHGPFVGGIFGFCFEGAITKHFNTETAFLYSNAYALILEKKLNRFQENHILDL